MVDPALEDRDLRIRQSSRTLEVAVSWLRLPRRHRLAFHRTQNLARTRSDIFEGDKVEGAELSGTVTTGAVVPDDRRNIFIKGDLLGARRCRGSEQDGAGKNK